VKTNATNVKKEAETALVTKTHHGKEYLVMIRKSMIAIIDDLTVRNGAAET
jgi:hypothetical protein